MSDSAVIPDQIVDLGVAIRDVARRCRGDERATVDGVAELLRAALEHGVVIPEPYRRPHPDHYVMYPLYVADDGSVSLAAAVWGVGQRTPIHDHLTWGVIGIVAGVEAEERYRIERTNVSPPVYERTLHHEPGDVTICCTTDDDVHAVSCASDEPCVSIHAYGTDIGVHPRRTYDPASGKVSPFISAWAPVDLIA